MKLFVCLAAALSIVALTARAQSPPPPPIDPTGPSLSAALQEQLGLKLDSERGPVEVLVIDRFQRSAEN
jgi:uncharacterized protein (TIGR03435 family)